jgi:hypothetical protein
MEITEAIKDLPIVGKIILGLIITGIVTGLVLTAYTRLGS